MRRLWVWVAPAAMLLAAAPARAASVPAAEDYFTAEQIARAASYRGPRYALSFGALALSLLVLALLALPPGARLRAGIERAARGRRWLHGLMLVVLVALVPVLATLPLDIAGWRHDRSFGLVTNSLGGFLRDAATATAFAFVATAVAALGFVAVARWLPRAWPAVVTAAGAGLTFLLVFLLPVVYEPAFNTFRPVDAATRARVLALAERAGVEVRDVLVADASRRTTKNNAYVSGIGSTRRVVLYDTLLATAPRDEVDVVVAHELAHVKHQDVLRGTLLGVGGVVAGVAVLWALLRRERVRRLAGASGPGDPNVIPFLALFVAVATLVTLPLANAVSRHMEARADRTSIEVTADPRAAIGLERRLALSNIADLRPNGFVRWMFFTHPPVLERIAIALEYEEAPA